MKEDHHDARRPRHTPEQVVRKLREADRLLGEGADIAALARHLGMPGRPSTGGATSTAGCRPTTPSGWRGSSGGTVGGKGKWPTKRVRSLPWRGTPGAAAGPVRA